MKMNIIFLQCIVEVIISELIPIHEGLFNHVPCMNRCCGLDLGKHVVPSRGLYSYEEFLFGSHPLVPGVLSDLCYSFPLWNVDLAN